MKSLKALIATLSLILSSVGLIVVTASAASAAPQNINIWTLNGTRAAGADCITNGCTMKSKAHPGRTIIADTSAHTLHWSNGAHIGMDPTCSFIVTNPSGDFGTYWTLQVASGNGLYYVNRACGGEMGTPNDANDTRWGVCDVLNGANCSGWYLRLNLVGA